ncbi:MAG TPA: AAA family ATPase [Sphingopyxis sp.]|uniref:AAA family ATPase n=1 Tax=Sphingopyxis sp. TaxID=1908224 RepID=UPI002BBC0A37|nr:AAA family ATPase [Sphingopyxis sp.]HWW59134.1 AAA family ATPase [Sphingopyxis sp.]
MYFTHLVFQGPRKLPAAIEFGPGLNLIYGPSNTGKSSILDAIDFMFGRVSRPLKELPEHDGYEDIFLGINFAEDGAYTVVRSLQGGNFTCFEGTHFERPSDQVGTVLRPGDASKKMGSLRDFILERIGLAGKELKKNQRNEKERLTLRNLSPLIIITEQDIQRESSPYIREQYTNVTVDKSRLRFLLTGVDDKSLIPEEKEGEVISRQARLQLLAEFIDESESRIDRLDGGENFRTELEEQQSRLERAIDQERQVLSASEVEYRQALNARNSIRTSYAEAEERLAEISEMLARFDLLERQYSTDLQRLENIREAGTLFFALPSENCPFCGSKPEHHDPKSDCQASTEAIVSAAEGEQAKIRSLQGELGDVIETLKIEHRQVHSQLPEIRTNLLEASAALVDISPQISAQRSRFSEFLDKKSEVERNMELFENLDRLQQKQREIEQETQREANEDDPTSPLPVKPLFDLSRYVAELLDDWGLVESPQVHFDKETRDFVINGKHRSSNGKGHRAITHAAATLGLLKFTEAKKLPHPGFVILDSPLLAYEKPENEDDDLSGTDVNLKFLRSLAGWTSCQTIILENKKSIPAEFETGEGVTRFTKSEASGRYGFFPIE